MPNKALHWTGIPLALHPLPVSFVVIPLGENVGEGLFRDVGLQLSVGVYSFRIIPEHKGITTTARKRAFRLACHSMGSNVDR